jgi:hypothetical protein
MRYLPRSSGWCGFASRCGPVEGENPDSPPVGVQGDELWELLYRLMLNAP